VAQIIAAGAPFEDMDFPPSEESLSLQGNYKDLKWKRASEIFENPAIFREGITANDVN